MADTMTVYGAIVFISTGMMMLVTFVCLGYFVLLQILHLWEKKDLVQLLNTNRKEKVNIALRAILDLKQMEVLLTDLQQDELPAISARADKNLRLTRRINFYFWVCMIVGNSAFVLGVLFVLFSIAFDVDMFW